MKKYFFSIISLICAAFILSSSLSAQIFFKVEGEGLKSPSWIFGTHHLAPISFIDSVPGVSEALESVDAVVGEIDMASMQANPMALVPYMTAPGDSTLIRLFSPEEFEHLDGEFRKWSGGISLALFDNLKPLVANMTIALNMVSEDIPGFVPGDQLDTYFQSVAAMGGKKIIPLESVEEQGEFLFNGVSVADQAKALKEMLDDPSKAKREAVRLNEYYFNQNIEDLLKASLEENENPRMFENILFRRNSNWLNLLPQIMRDQPVFIAVGALHLAGEKGIVEGLRRQGFTVTAVMP